MRTVLLYGHLGQQFGRRHRFDIATPAEALRALKANHAGFEQALLAHGGGYHILTGFDDRFAHEVAAPSGEREAIRIVPSVAGAGTGIGEAFAMWVASSFAISTTTYAVIAFAVNVAVSMVISGIANALFAPDTPDLRGSERPDNKPSDTFNGPVNTLAQGHPVPVGYGRLRVGSQVISAGLSVEQIPV